MSLRDVLQFPEFDGLTDQQALDYGNETVVIGGSDEWWTYAGVEQAYGVVAAEKLGAAIKETEVAAGVPLECGWGRYINPGIPLNLDTTQGLLTAIGATHPDIASVCDSLKEIGVAHGTRWQGWGVSQPSVEDIATARTTIATQAFVDWATNAWTAVSDGIANGTVTTKTEARSIWNAD